MMGTDIERFVTDKEYRDVVSSKQLLAAHESGVYRLKQHEVERLEGIIADHSGRQKRGEYRKSKRVLAELRASRDKGLPVDDDAISDLETKVEDYEAEHGI